MKALLLSAGLGTRLRPLTDRIPKCLLPINNKPLLYHWLDLLEKENVSEVIINTHYYADKIEEAIKKRENRIKIILSYEAELLGSGGTLFSNQAHFKDEEDFFILYSDNLTNISLRAIKEFHKSVDSVFTTYIYKTDNPSEKGIFEYDLKTGKVISFEEKPKHPKSNYANSGIGLLNKEIFRYSTPIIPLDFGKNIMPQIADRMYVMQTDKHIIDIGTIGDYRKAENIWEELLKEEL